MKKTLASMIIAAGLSTGVPGITGNATAEEDNARVYTVSTSDREKPETITLDLSMGDRRTCNYSRGQNQKFDRVIFDFNNYMSGRVMRTQRNGDMGDSIQSRLFDLRNEIKGENRNCYEIMADAFDINYRIN